MRARRAQPASTAPAGTLAPRTIRTLPMSWLSRAPDMPVRDAAPSAAVSASLVLSRSGDTGRRTLTTGFVAPGAYTPMPTRARSRVNWAMVAWARKPRSRATAVPASGIWEFGGGGASSA